MPITARKLGPGVLELGAGALDPSIQLTACKVTPSENVEAGERTKVLTGDVLEDAGSVSFAYVLEGNVLQDDPGVASVVDWSWANAGTLQAFTFTPNTAGGRTVSGFLYPVPLVIGGEEVDAAPMSSDFTWRIDGTPDLAATPPV